MSDKEITIGAYRGVPVGQGGFATVYRVSGPNGGVFALKLADQDVDEATRDSLYHEFCTQSELVHPQVVHAHEFGLHDGRPFIVFDWIDGAPLFEQFPRPTVDDFVTTLRGMASVLLFIHHRGWVHGDLKPENLRWRTAATGNAQDQSHVLCLLDFGLARPVGDANRPRGAGTVGYCAPEFLNSRPADGRADWYAVGVILYEWVFSVRPYAADEPVAEIAGHLEGAPNFDLPKLRPTPVWADAVIARLLAKSPDDRADDETSLLAWLAEFDPTFEPASLLNEQIRWHARSESLRLRSHEDDLLECLSQELHDGLSVIWSIDTHGRASDGWIRRAAGLCSAQGYGVEIDRSEDLTLRLREASAAPGCEPRVHITSYGNLSVDRPLVPSGVEGVEPFHPQRSLSLLPWDRAEIRSFLKGVVGDEDVAETWTDAIEKATCGLPSAVSDLIHHLVASKALSVDADGWGLDDAATDAWRDQHAGRHIADVFGALSTPELRLCEWLALGEGRGASDLLRPLWSDPDSGLDATLAKLVARGLITCYPSATKDSFDLRMRLRGHDAIVRSSMAAEDVTRRSRQLAEVIESSGVIPEQTRAEILAHAFARAAMWDKSADHCLRAATFAIKAEERDRAMHYIALAQDSARQIEDVTQRTHWMGQVRMVEGDLQKAAGQLDAARKTYCQLLALCRTTGDQRLLAETLHDLGDLYRIMRLYDKGIRAERRARRIWEALGDRAELSRSLNSLGLLCRIASDLAGARAFFTQALDIQRELGLDQYAATNLNNIGLICWQEYNFTEAEFFFRQALAIQERLNVAVEIARVLNNLGAINFVQGFLDESADYFTRAASLNAAAGAESEKLYNHRNLVEVALEQGDLRAAVALSQEVYHACQELGDVSTLGEVAALLADAYFRAGDYRSALRAHAETTQISLSLTNDELRVYLDIQRAAHLHRFGRDKEAVSLLDAVAPIEPLLSNRYQHLDALILRMQIAARSHDEEAMSRLLSIGLLEAGAIGAPHKAAQLALVRLTGSRDDMTHRELAERISAFLLENPRWHWRALFQGWQARELLRTGNLAAALESVTSIASDLHRDGCCEWLWRILVLQGQICQAQADYEPALSALDEAARTLKIVLSTVDDESERAAYLDCEDVRTLEKIKERITELVS